VIVEYAHHGRQSTIKIVEVALFLVREGELVSGDTDAGDKKPYRRTARLPLGRITPRCCDLEGAGLTPTKSITVAFSKGLAERLQVWSGHGAAGGGK